MGEFELCDATLWYDNKPNICLHVGVIATSKILRYCWANFHKNGNDLQLCLCLVHLHWTWNMIVVRFSGPNFVLHRFVVERALAAVFRCHHRSSVVMYGAKAARVSSILTYWLLYKGPSLGPQKHHQGHPKHQQEHKHNWASRRLLFPLISY